MFHNLKALGLALLAVFVFGAVAAEAASASSFHSEKEKTVLTGGEDEFGAVFGTKGSLLAVECEETFGGTVNSAVSVPSITVHPTYSNCKKTLGLTPTVDTEGCNYILYAETTGHLKTEGNQEFDAPVEIECEKTEPKKGEIIQHAVKITTSVCTITILSTGVKLHGATYDNEGSGASREFNVTLTVDKIKYKAPGIGCAAAGLKAEGEDGFLTGVGFERGITVAGFEDKDTEGPKPHQDEFKEGSQVGVFWG